MDTLFVRKLQLFVNRPINYATSFYYARGLSIVYYRFLKQKIKCLVAKQYIRVTMRSYFLRRTSPKHSSNHLITVYFHNQNHNHNTSRSLLAHTMNEYPIIMDLACINIS